MNFNEWWDTRREILEKRGAKSALLTAIFEECFLAWNTAVELTNQQYVLLNKENEKNKGK